MRDYRDIEHYYISHLRSLPKAKQFHFLSRLYLWSHKKKYKTELASLRAWYIPTVLDLQSEVVSINRARKGRVGKRAFRKEAEKRHFRINLYNTLFFKILFAKEVFDAELQSTLYELDIETVRQSYNTLLASQQDILTLSTPAINFIYHVHRFFSKEFGDVPAELLLQIANEQNLDNQADTILSKIYLLTHAVIGASNFYSSLNISESVYMEMVKAIELVIKGNFTKVSLDQKLEFLVCCRLCGYDSGLYSKIQKEAYCSFSDDGDFVVDTLNAHSNKVKKKTLAMSEHRNALAIMAFDLRGNSV